jgi:hypothetical protein
MGYKKIDWDSLLKERRTIIGLLIFSVTIVCVWFGLSLLNNQGNEIVEDIVSSDYQQYSVDFSTIIVELEKGDFRALEEAASSEPPSQENDPETLIIWAAKDYLLLANSMHALSWGEPVDDWNVNYLTLNTTCSNIDTGFKAAYFQFYKTDRKGWRTRRYVSTIWIFPQNNEVSITKEEIFPTKVEWGGIPFRDLMFTGDQIVKITENEGGKDFWEEVPDSCELSLNFTNKIWVVTYTLINPDNIDNFLKFQVSPDGNILEITTNSE